MHHNFLFSLPKNQLGITTIKSNIPRNICSGGSELRDSIWVLKVIGPKISIQAFMNSRVEVLCHGNELWEVIAIGIIILHAVLAVVPMYRLKFQKGVHYINGAQLHLLILQAGATCLLADSKFRYPKCHILTKSIHILTRSSKTKLRQISFYLHPPSYVQPSTCDNLSL